MRDGHHLQRRHQRRGEIRVHGAGRFFFGQQRLARFRRQRLHHLVDRRLLLLDQKRREPLAVGRLSQPSFR